MHGSDQDTTHDKKEEALIAYCFEDRTREEMMAYLGLENQSILERLI